MFKPVINIPTSIINTLWGSFLQTQAAKGAARTPPIINPTIFPQCYNNNIPMVAKKVIDSATVTKNSAELTEPMAYRGWFPFATKVVVTMGPQPPPPMASKNPPANPNGIVLVFVFAWWVFLNTLMSMMILMINK